MVSLDNYPQFIAWEFRHVPDKPKPRKVPIDPVTRTAIDPHNPANWRTRAEIERSGHHVGFVLSDRDPFFFLDLDDCRTATGWTDEATQIFNAFAGFAAEVSISGTGLHIMGTCNKAALADRRRKFKLPSGGNVEFYTKLRFVALGHGFTGDFSRDGTSLLVPWISQGNPAEDVELTDGPEPGYTGPSDDEELIARMLRAQGSIAQVMGSKASVRDLWNGDASILCQLFPSSDPSRAYDNSQADAALCFHLAFWTGKDAARIDRLFRRSALMRPKWDERRGAMTYGQLTVRNALAQQHKIYDVVQQPTTAPGSATADTLPAGEYLTVGEMITYFAGCVYVRDHHAVMVPDGSLLKPDQFSAMYGGHIFQLSADAALGGTTKTAFEAFTQCRIHRFPRVKEARFLPRSEPGAIIGDAVNTFFPATVEAEPGDVSPFLEHLAKLLPDQRDRNILLTYMISLVQNPGVKFQWAPVLQGTQGNGTSWLARCLTHAIGEKFCHKPKPEDITNKFNGWMVGKLFIEVQEIQLDGRYEMIENIKDWITDSRIEGHSKGVNQFMIDNFANWLLVTNHKNAIPVTANDRRFAMLFTAQQSLADLTRDGMGGDYFPKLWDWSRAGGFKHITHYLRTAPIPASEFDPAGLCHRAPQTTSTAEAIAASLGRAEQEIMEAVASGDAGFRNGWISTYAVEQLLAGKRIQMSPQKLATMMTGLGYRKCERSGVMIMEEGGKRPVLYVRADLYQPTMTHVDYMRAQGYATPVAPGAVVPFKAA